MSNSLRFRQKFCKVFLQNYNSISLAKTLQPGFNLVVFDAKLHFLSCELEGIDALGVVVVVGTRVGSKYLFECFEMLGIESLDEFRIENYRDLLWRFGKQTLGHAMMHPDRSVWMTICEWQVGLDVEDVCAVHEVGSFHLYYRTIGGVEFDAEDADGRESNVVRTIGAACGEDTHPFVAAKTRRTHRCLEF